MSLQARCVYGIYRLLIPVAMAFMLPGAWSKMRKRGGTLRDIARRLGKFSPEEASKLAESSDCYWFHAVSVGEVNVALKLLAEIRQKQPQTSLVLSTTTTTGFQLANQEKPEGTQVIYSPVDFTFVVRRFLDILKPRKIVLIEAEVWPNLLAEATKRNIPVLLANARLSPRSASRYKRFRWFINPIFSQLNRILVQFPEDTDAWVSFGLPPEKIKLVGSVKYDDHPAKPKRVADFRALLESLWGNELPPLVLLASSFPGEELGVLLALKSQNINTKVLLVPRHVERAPVLESELAAAGFSSQRRSTLPASSPNSETDSLIIDTTGELRDWQYLPQVVVIGKSFLHKGGQNPVEAIAAATPVITGPHMENFGSLMRQLLAADGIQQVEDLDSAAQAIRQVFASTELASQRTQRAKASLAVHQGATERSARVILLG